MSSVGSVSTSKSEHWQLKPGCVQEIRDMHFQGKNIHHAISRWWINSIKPCLEIYPSCPSVTFQLNLLTHHNGQWCHILCPEATRWISLDVIHISLRFTDIIPTICAHSLCKMLAVMLYQGTYPRYLYVPVYSNLSINATIATMHTPYHSSASPPLLLLLLIFHLSAPQFLHIATATAIPPKWRHYRRYYPCLPAFPWRFGLSACITIKSILFFVAW